MIHINKFYAIFKNSFIVYTILIFIKLILFHWFCFHYVAVSSLWQSPIDFFSFYFAKLLPALFISQFLLITKKRRWTIFVSFLIDIWLIINILYFRAYGYFVNTYVIHLVFNIRGVGDSIYTYVKPVFLIFIIFSILWCVYVYKIKSFCMSRKKFFFSMIVCILLFIFDWNYGSSKKYNDDNYNCFKLVNKYNNGANTSGGLVNKFWIEAQSPLHFFAQVLYEIVTSPFKEEQELLTNEDTKLIHQFIDSTQNIKLIPKENLLIILFESLENWTLEIQDNKGNFLLPNLKALTMHENVLYAPNIKSQAKRGMSGDGQLIINTGLLPMDDYVVCELYGHNSFPNFAHLYENSVIINPLHGCWNQDIVTTSYGYKKLVEPAGKEKATDDVIIQATLQELSTIQSPFCILALTISSHTPFNCQNIPPISMPDDCPKKLHDYLTCCHYTDSCLGILLNDLNQNSLLSNTTIVITGDHKIFNQSLLREFKPFAEKYKYTIPYIESYCPLIIYSPSIKNQVKITDTCYQMDIYPTIIHCIEAENYFWKGFGVNLLCDSTRKNRRISEETSYLLSEKIHRSNFFKNRK